MATVKISGLPAASAVVGANEFEINEAGTSKKVTGSQIATFVAGGPANNVAITGGSITGITDLAVADGGTGASTLAANNVLLGNGTSALQVVAPGASGNVLTSDGTTWTSTNPQGVPTGTMLDFGGSSAPTGYLLCDGSNVSRSTQAALFAVLGTEFGAGDGSTTFGLPDFRRKVAVGSGGTSTATLGNARGNTGGAETHTLVSGEMPSHTHTQNAHTHTVPITTNGGSGNGFAGPDGTGNTTTSSTTATNQNTGGGGAHNNIQPSLVVTKIIKT
jgi:microcystin-dependent protein